MDREQIAEARREAGAALEQLKAQEKRLSESREPARPTGQCDECEKRMLGMQIELRVAQMKAEQLEEELDKLLNDYLAERTSRPSSRPASASTA